jgi:hypothetical protein
VNVGITAYVALWKWLLAVWPLDDSVGTRLTDHDWQVGAEFRALDALVAGLLVAGGLFALNWIATRRTTLLPRPWAPRLAIAGGVVVWAAGTVGAIKFLITRPWF